MNWLELIGLTMMVSGVTGVIVCLFILPPDPAICPACQEMHLAEGEDLCPGCDAFIKTLSQCEKHRIVYEGKECPKCQYGIFAEKR